MSASSRFPTRFAAAALGAVLASAAVRPALAERYEIDPSHTVVGFLVEHLGYAKVLGRFREVEGGFDYDAASRTLQNLSVSVATESVYTGHDARDEHVRKADFLDVKRHPTMRFTAGSTVLDGDAGGTVEGTLELLGESRPITLQVTLNKAEVYPFGHKRYTYGISARGTLSRSEWGMDYGVANGLVGDEIELLIETEALAAD